jgi:hemolysin III
MMGVINLSYFVTGVTMFLPALILLLRTRFRGLPHILLATVLFMLALWFRQIDAVSTALPMGTHWLWHVCCGVGAWFLANYLYLIANQQVESKRDSVTVPNVT